MEEYWTRKGPVDLAIYRKRTEAPRKGVADKPLLFLVHGSSLSALPGFDLHVPDREGYSFMERFADWGFDVWTMDHECYGKSSRTDANSDIACGVADVQAAMSVIERETGLRKMAVYGQSGGALRAAAFAQAEPEIATKLVLDAFVWTGKDSPTLAKRRERIDEWRASNMRPIDRNFIHSIFKRDIEGTAVDDVIEAVADAELAYGNAMPTGTYVDMSVNLPLVDPTRIKCPVLIIRGVHDGIASEEDLIEFFRLLANDEKQFVKLPGQAHVGPLGVNRDRFWHVMHAFLTLPSRKDSLPDDVQRKPA